jgi:hypothetical protein
VTSHDTTDVLAAAAVAGALSGVPSTVHAVLTGRSPLAAARAAGELLGRPGLARGTLAHAVLSIAWAFVLARRLPRRRAALWGGVAGAAIAALDLAIARRRFPTVAALPTAPQVGDHVAFGALVGLVLQVRSRRTRSLARPCAS